MSLAVDLRLKPNLANFNRNLESLALKSTQISSTDSNDKKTNFLNGPKKTVAS